MATLNITWTIDDDKVAGIRNDFAAYHGYKSTIPDPQNLGQTIPNPETQNAFIKRKIGEFVRESVKAHRVNAAREAAATTANTAAESIALT